MDDKAPYIAVKVPEKGDNRGKKIQILFLWQYYVFSKCYYKPNKCYSKTNVTVKLQLRYNFKVQRSYASETYVLLLFTLKMGEKNHSLGINTHAYSVVITYQYILSIIMNK